MYLPIPETRVLAIGGPARSGKDTAAKTLLAIDPARTLALAMSDAIAHECRLHHGMTTRDPRLLQKVGYALRQAVPTIWLDAVYWRIVEARPRLALITGVRFPDELAMVRAMGGQTVWVDRVREDGRFVRAADRDLNFPTETALTRTDFDHLLLNPDGAEGRFKLHVLSFYEKLWPATSHVSDAKEIAS